MPEQLFYTSETVPTRNRAYLLGDAVRVSFFVKESRLVMIEECYFYLMASMRKMRMRIPLTYTLDFFEQLFSDKIRSEAVSQGIIHFLVYRKYYEGLLSKADVAFYFEIEECPLLSQRGIEMDIIKEINVNTHLLSNIRVHSPENVYAEIYASENDLDDVILLNPNKRIARSIFGNLLFLEGNTIKIPKQTEGAYISPLMENFVTFVHKNRMAEIEQTELIAFESQKSDEIIMISDEKGISPVMKIRNKTFVFDRFYQMLKLWQEQL